MIRKVRPKEEIKQYEVNPGWYMPVGERTFFPGFLLKYCGQELDVELNEETGLYEFYRDTDMIGLLDEWMLEPIEEKEYHLVTLLEGGNPMGGFNYKDMVTDKRAIELIDHLASQKPHKPRPIIMVWIPITEKEFLNYKPQS